MQYDSTGRRVSDPYNEPTESKKSINDIKFTLTPAHSLEDLYGTEDMDLDEQPDTIVSNKHADDIDTRSLEEKLNAVRNANFSINI